MIGVAVLFAVIVIAYMMLRKKMQSSDVVQIKQLRQGTKESKFSMEILYQKLYVIYIRTPFFKRYLFKIRRRLEIINIDDEYLTRKQTSKILTNALCIIIPLTIIIIFITKSNTLLLAIMLIFEVFMIDSLVDGMVDKLDNKLLVQQIDFFAETSVLCDDEEFEYGLYCFSAPIYDANHRLIAAISVSGPKTRMLSKSEEIKKHLLCSAKKITSLLEESRYTVEDLQKNLV